MEELLAALLEIFLEIFAEALFEFAAEFIGALIWRVLAEVLDTSEFKNPLLGSIGYVFLGGVTGCVSLVIFPHPLFQPARIPGLSVIISPVLAGLGMWLVGFILRKQNKKVMQIESFGYGFAFAFGMALVRFLFHLAA
ncbi:MAG TPA: hypothetical protein VNI81_12440 [Candidatus Limnocylindrales bacterium]|nr:hypothetical protein [Candidatus Limnocylindrales bacterium]